LQKRKAAEKVRREAKLNGNAHEMARYDKGSTLLNAIMSKKRDTDSAPQQVSQSQNEARSSSRLHQHTVPLPSQHPFKLLI